MTPDAMGLPLATDPNPHILSDAEKIAFKNGSTWDVRTFSLSVSLWGFAVTAQNQNVFKALIESAWVAAWDRRPLRWVLNSGYGYPVWNKVLAWCDGERAAYLPITDDQARSLYPDEASFNEDWGWHDDDTDGTESD